MIRTNHHKNIYKTAWLLFIMAALFSGCSLISKNLMKGDINFSEGKYHSAIEFYSLAIDENPGNTEGYIKRALAKSKIERHNEAVEDYNKALTIDDDLLSALISKGVELIQLDDLTAAEKSVRLALVEDPYNKRAFFTLGYIYSLRQDFEAAIFYYTRAIQLDSLYTEAYVNRANAKGILGNHKTAIEDYNKAISLNPLDDNLLLARGYDKSFEGEHKSAIHDFTEAIKLNAQNFTAYLFRSESLKELKELKSALNDLNFILTLEPLNGLVLFRRGVIKMELGKQKEACNDFISAYQNGYAPSLEAVKEYCRRR